ncbi:unnamed protein product [Prorocentrum cordatum]|uniref:Uncharacterized protein n=1 Tax=Prorocentrum cordatum TaxID=2364126 RepID=A0ABN9T115_9DINO|nr:unnamed protein product [Polarella glacialis]
MAAAREGFAGGGALQGRASSSAASAHPDFSAAKGSLGLSRLGAGLGRGADTRGLVDAATRGDLPALRKLAEGPNGGLSSGRPDLNARDLQGRTVLMHAVASGSQEIVEYLLAKRADPHAADNVQATAMHYVSKRARNMRSPCLDAVQADILALLLRSRASLEERDRNGCTALLAAVSCGDEAVALGLLRARADVNAKDSDGQSSLEVATAFEMGSMVELLRRAPEVQRAARELQEAADAAAAEEERQAARAERKAAKAAAEAAALAAAEADEAYPFFGGSDRGG